MGDVRKTIFIATLIYLEELEEDQILVVAPSSLVVCNNVETGLNKRCDWATPGLLCTDSLRSFI